MHRLIILNWTNMFVYILIMSKIFNAIYLQLIKDPEAAPYMFNAEMYFFLYIVTHLRTDLFYTKKFIRLD